MREFNLFVSSLLLLASTLIAQEIPPGTVIPAMLQSTLDARNAKVGQKIKARVMQDVRLFSKSRIRAGSRLIGRVVEVTRPTATSGSRLVISFDRLTTGGTWSL